MFVPLTETEKQTFLAQTNGSFIPGYTGHCPTLKFRFGRCYGANTKDIMQELRDKGAVKNVMTEPYRVNDPGKMILDPLHPISYAKDQKRDPMNEIKCRGAKYILGYTGYIPGLNFRYGKSYSRSADDSMCEFGNRQRELRRKWESNFRATSAPKMNTIRSRDDVSRALKDYQEKHKFKERTISPDCPPIAGYTGHIPRVKGSEASLSQRYYCVAKQGLAMLEQDKNKRNNLTEVQTKINQILNDAESKYNKHID